MKLLILISLFFLNFYYCYSQDVKYGAIKVRFIDVIKNNNQNLIVISKCARLKKIDIISYDSILYLPVGNYKIIVKGFDKFNFKRVIWKNIDIYPDKLFFLEIYFENGKFTNKKLNNSKWQNCG